jgi:hypothetical protein
LYFDTAPVDTPSCLAMAVRVMPLADSSRIRCCTSSGTRKFNCGLRDAARSAGYEFAKEEQVNAIIYGKKKRYIV